MAFPSGSPRLQSGSNNNNSGHPSSRSKRKSGSVAAAPANNSSAGGDFRRKQQQGQGFSDERKKLWGFQGSDFSGKKGGGNGNGWRKPRRNTNYTDVALAKATPNGLTMENVTIVKRGENIDAVIAAKCSNLKIHENSAPKSHDDVDVLHKGSQKVEDGHGHGHGHGRRDGVFRKSFSRNSKVCPLAFDEQAGAGIDERYEFKDVGLDDGPVYDNSFFGSVTVGEKLTKGFHDGGYGEKNGSEKNDSCGGIYDGGFGGTVAKNTHVYDAVDDFWAHSMYACSPPPNSLPIPKFSLPGKKPANQNSSAVQGNGHADSVYAKGFLKIDGSKDAKTTISTRYITDPFGVDACEGLNLRKALNI